MLLIIIFSYNRAMQLDHLLKSSINRLKIKDYKIVVVYHTTGMHHEGYVKLQIKYEKYTNINFFQRQKQFFSVISYFKTLYCRKNIRRAISHSFLRNRNYDNFKSLLENLLNRTTCEYVMFNTDDGYFFNDVLISDDIFTLIKADPINRSYRLYIGENLDEFPNYIHREKDYLFWSYFENAPFSHWTYPFAVDGTIYHTKSILRIVKKVPYHNPITLESYVVEYAKENKVLKLGLGPYKSTLVCTKLNRVSTSSLNPTINISVDYLNSKYLEGYELELEIPLKVTNANIVPLKVFLVKENHKLPIYMLDQYGKDVQDALGSEGAKYQV